MATALRWASGPLTPPLPLTGERSMKKRRRHPSCSSPREGERLGEGASSLMPPIEPPFAPARSAVLLLTGVVMLRDRRRLVVGAGQHGLMVLLGRGRYGHEHHRL